MLVSGTMHEHIEFTRWCEFARQPFKLVLQRLGLFVSKKGGK